MGFLRQGVAKEALSSHPAFLAPPVSWLQSPFARVGALLRGYIAGRRGSCGL
jgi:hypothetical protein